MKIKMLPDKANAHEVTKRDQKIFLKGLQHARSIIADRKDCKTAANEIQKEITKLELHMTVKRHLK